MSKKKKKISKHFPDGTVVKKGSANAGDVRDVGSIPGLGRLPLGGNGSPLQYSCLGNPRTEGPGELQAMGHKRVRHN